MPSLKRALRAGQNLYSECRSAAHEAKDFPSFLQLSRDFALSRFLPCLPMRMRGRERQVELRNGVKLRYRLNRGDIQSIREVWLERAYRLPLPVSNGVLIDLGANLGFTSIWLAREYGFARVIAVEPDAGNAALVRKNFDLNKIAGDVVEAAIGPMDGKGRFQGAAESNQGRVSNEGREIAVVSMQSILNRFQVSEIDLVKMDIEGGEQELLAGSPGWLYQTKAIIAEFHPTLIDYPAVTSHLEEMGFKYIRANTAFPDNMDAFYRQTL